MGFETAALIGGLAVSVVAGYKQYEAQKDIVSAQDDAAEEAQNRQVNQDRDQRRQELRQERIRRAQIMQASENQGTSGSSSESSAVSNLAANVSISQGQRAGGQAAAGAVSDSNQRAANASAGAQQWGMIGQVGNKVAASQGGAYSLFNSMNGPKGNTASQISGPNNNLYNNIFTQ